MAAELELALVREALQTRLLVELMSNAMHKELVLKGGMAMRAVHGSVRYTKDIASMPTSVRPRNGSRALSGAPSNGLCHPA